MSMRAFDTFTRQAGAVVSRRSSLLTIGGAAAAATAISPVVGDAKKKKNKDKCKKKEKQRCNNDAEECKDSVVLGCEGNAECIASLTPCCDTCSADGFLVCFIAAQS
jgi:hypothetical protein